MKTIKTKAAAATIRVPADCKTLNEAVERVDKNRRLTTIVVGKGTHVVEKDERGSNFVLIRSSMNIIGDPGVSNNEIIIMGGFLIVPKIQDDVHLQNMTVRHLSKNCSGVVGGSSFTMKDVIVEQCTGHGISSGGKDHIVGKCINVDVKVCTGCGISTHLNSTIEMSGTDTKVHNNCTKSYTLEYGMECYGADCFIKLIHPLTKEKVAFCNSKITYSGERNYGCRKGGSVEKQIVTIFPEK